MKSAYENFNVGNIIDLVVAIVAISVMFVFFFKKKSFKLLVVYSLLFLAYIGIIIADDMLNLPVAMSIARLMSTFLVVALVVVYQNDFKTIFFNITKKSERGGEENRFSDEQLRNAVDEIIKACQNMSKARVGALIVIAPNTVPKHILETGTELGALVSSPLLESIFNTKAPFHDGAVMVKGNKVLAAGCFLPLSQTNAVAKNLGTRHRAGIGITEETDMLTIIVSEETGVISIARKGELHRFITSERLRDILHETFRISQTMHRRSL